VYNSRSTLAHLARRLTDALEKTAGGYEIVLVDDGSADGSWEEIEALSQHHSAIVGIKLSRNFGQHNALLAGIRAASFEFVVTLDDDLQNPPEEIGRLLDELETGGDVVLGVPRESHYGPARTLLTRTSKVGLRRVLGLSAIREFSAFRVFRTQLRDAFADYQGPYVSIDMLLTWSTVKIVAVPVEHHQRSEGRSNYSFRRLVKHTLDLVTFYSTRPLQLASWLGFVTTGGGVVLFAYVLARYFAGTTVQGFTFLASVVLVFSGAQLLVLGIIGEYLSRLHFRAIGRPAYVVAKTVTGA
jgi:glycosyltransferase involved in cell wall biosynthesis